MTQSESVGYQQTLGKTEAQPQNTLPPTSRPMSQKHMLIIALVIIFIVFILPVGAIILFDDSASIEGKWMMTSANIINDDGSINQEASDYYAVSADGGKWMEFLPDGTFQNGDSEGVYSSNEDATWETRGGTLTLTSSSESMTYKYLVSGNTLTLETEVYWGNTVKIVLQRV